MSYSELELVTLNLLVDNLAPGLKRLMDDLLLKKFDTQAIRTILLKVVRDMTKGQLSFTELAIQEYLERVDRGEISPTKPDDPDSGVNLGKLPDFGNN